MDENEARREVRALVEALREKMRAAGRGQWVDDATAAYRTLWPDDRLAVISLQPHAGGGTLLGLHGDLTLGDLVMVLQGALEQHGDTGPGTLRRVRQGGA